MSDTLQPKPTDDLNLLRVFRGAGSLDTTSDAEIELLREFDKLPEPWVVIHSAKWIAHETRNGTEGEADFIVAHPSHGVLVIEVKGGKIKVERNRWVSVAKSGVSYEIKDPAQQADRNRRNLQTWLEKDSRTRQFRYPVFTAVAFPDVGVSGDMRPDLPQDLIIDATRMMALERTLEEIFAYWKKKYSQLNMSGQSAVDALIDLLVPTMTLESRVSDIFERERRKIEQLTEEQFHLLRNLQFFRQLAIIGGAGTGKTMLAMEKAQQLATADFRVLFLCFNTNLARWLEANLASENIHVSTFHSLVNQARQWAGLSKLRHSELIDEAADALVTAASIIRAPDSTVTDKLFDAIIVDEGQDFAEDWWLALPDMLKDPQDGIFYVFFDDNQNVYQQIGNLPIKHPHIPLTKNCRNTQEIHKVVARYTTSQVTECIGPQGRPVEVTPAKDHKAAQEALRKVLHGLVNEQGVSSEDIVMLTPRSERTSRWKSDTQIGRFILTWDMATTMVDAIRLCTIYSFKGLESPVVILSELERANQDVNDALMYVGLSRARNQVLVIGDLPAPS